MSYIINVTVQDVECSKTSTKIAANIPLEQTTVVIKFLIGIKETRVQYNVSLRSELNWKVKEDEEQKQIICIIAVCDDGIHLYACNGICRR